MLVEWRRYSSLLVCSENEMDRKRESHYLRVDRDSALDSQQISHESDNDLFGTSKSHKKRLKIFKMLEYRDTVIFR